MLINNDLQITLVGTPNAGKTSLFNYLTGEQLVVGNWEGVTVTIAKSKFDCLGYLANINDLPGCYSLVASRQMSLEEQLVCRYLQEDHQEILVNIINLDNLARDLYFSLQLLEQLTYNRKLLIVLNISNNAYNDLASKLQEIFKCQVICCNALTGFGVLELQQAILTLNNQLNNLNSYYKIYNNYLPTDLIAKIIDISQKTEITVGTLIRYLEGDFLAAQTLQQQNKELIIKNHINIDKGDIFFATKRYDFIKKYFIDDANNKNLKIVSLVDNLLLHKYFGLPVFLGIIYGWFLLITKIINITQDGINAVINTLAICHLNNGIIIGIITVFNFIPALFIMHVGLFVLENSGYIARIVVLLDRLMGFLGLSGKSLMPMILGFGCNVPAILGTRIIEQKRDRIITVLMTPFMSCNARLAVYSVFAMAFFKAEQGNMIFYLYVIGMMCAVITGFLLQTILPGSRTNLIMCLPNYKIPKFNLILKRSYYKVKSFLAGSGFYIVIFCSLLSLLKNVNLWQYNLINSAAFKYIMTIFKPMGIQPDNWQAVLGLFSGLIAKEVIIGSLNVFYQVNAQEISEMLYAKFGSIESAFAYLLFVLLCFPCVSVIASIAKELNKKWATFIVFWTTGVAYIIAVSYYQIATFKDHIAYSIKLLSIIATIIAIAFIVIKMFVLKNNKIIYKIPLESL